VERFVRYDETVRDYLIRKRLDPDSRESYVLLAGLLEEGLASCPVELQGDAVSRLYSPNPPAGYEVLFEDSDGSGSGGESAWGIDVRVMWRRRLTATTAS
jgi:hypothetical protein